VCEGSCYCCTNGCVGSCIKECDHDCGSNSNRGEGALGWNASDITNESVLKWIK
jgi:hypothetical protein